MKEVVEATSISAYYEQDHNRLDELFANFQEWKRKDFLRAKELFVAFKFGLQRHIVWEEEVLFPLFEEATGLFNEGPTQVMRLEHRMIADKLELIHKKVQVKDPNSDVEERELLSILSSHNDKEEKILYPAIDQIAEQSGATNDVFKKMREIPEERYKTCCEHA
ncbi:MAG TPA: hemerythrin domain-containing protein [Acidobacteriota bacterium]|jgi:hemerythrin-like domain-containing protein|nr:hemerythrin domain-containing protein [Acidobacteriota bacterium]